MKEKSKLKEVGTIQYLARLPQSLHVALKTVSKNGGQPMAWHMIKALEEYFKGFDLKN